MLWTLAIILIILWALGFLAFHVAGGLIHLLLVIAVIVIIYRLITGRRPVA
ncbi:MAG TPA: lmo0937 family membrane protein [Gemmatimonadaceae bacterium]|nr:lmo0937 family membrane protein [Gemmatimonadaceae bacterium]